MAIVFEQIETSIVEAPVSTGAAAHGNDKPGVDASQMRRTFEMMAQRSARLEAD